MFRRLALFVVVPAGILSAACRPSAPPVSISNMPTSVNDRRLALQPEQISWTSIDGSRHDLSLLSGKVVVLDFWATFCIPCREEIPHLNELQAKYGTEKLQVIGMHSGGDEDRPKIPEFQRQTTIEYPLAFPDDDLVQYIFAKDDRIPQTAVFDRRGRMIKKIVGFDPEIKKELDDAVENAINSR